jgi:phenylpropionate dioxygenase-like ring-hydroxylating dioxygenase large terminal subunit
VTVAWSALSATDYLDPGVLARETATMFRTAWQPVALASELANHNDFARADIAGHSVVVQNFDGALRAFENVCSHRQSPIHVCDRGNGPLQCPYHGWTFDSSGRPTGITHRKTFGELSDDVLAKLALDAWQVETRGPLVFVARAPATPFPQLGELAQLLGARHRCLAATSFELACNWKIILENGLDAYHVPLVHPSTLHKHGLQETARERFGDHSVGRFVAASGERVLRALRYAYAGAEIHDRYTHYLLFPNVYVVDVYGLYLAVSRMDPTGPESTRFHLWAFVTWDDAGGNRALREELNTNNAAFFRQGYEEDRAICERVQRALRTSERRAVFGGEEERIPMFHEAWRASLDGAGR